MNRMILSLLLLVSLPSYAKEFLSVCQRNPGIREAMVENMGKPCRSITREDLNNLNRLPITHRKLTQISSSDLQDLDHLEDLYLDTNQITHIEPGAFSDLSNLTHLSLSGNSISKLQPGVFAGLHRLRFLALSVNPLLDLSTQIFKDLPNLKSLLLDRTLLRRFPAGLCTVGPKLENIQIFDTRYLTEIDDFAFADCSSTLLILINGAPLTLTRKAAFHGVSEVIGLPANFDQDGEGWEQP